MSGKRVVRTSRVAPLTKEEQQYVEKSIAEMGGRRSIRAKACWRNAQRLLLIADDEKRLCYWECGLPIPHAWVTINGKVVDVTAEAVKRKLKRIGETHTASLFYEYRGVMVDRETVREHMLRSKSFSAVLGESWWTAGKPEFKKWKRG
jgi:hypothetical protein